MDKDLRDRKDLLDLPDHKGRRVLPAPLDRRDPLDLKDLLDLLDRKDLPDRKGRPVLPAQLDRKDPLAFRGTK